jgi:hypothetical protein
MTGPLDPVVSDRDWSVTAANFGCMPARYVISTPAA